MKEQLNKLSELQTLESHKQTAAGRKAKIAAEDVRGLWQDIRLLAQTIAADREKLAGQETTCARLESDLTALTSQCRELEKKLYGGEITNIKEIEQVRNRCDSLHHDINQRENQAMASLENCEQLTAKVGRDETCLQDKRRLHAEKQQLMAHEAARCDAEITDLDQRCRALEGQIDPALLRTYRDLARRLPNPVARVENGICGGCRRGIPTSQIVKAQAKQQNCDNCGRILLVD